MAANVNRVILVGRMTRDPELKHLPSGTSLCEFGLVVNRRYSVDGEKREEATFVDCKSWGKAGEIINQYCNKGSQLFVEGRLEQSSWQTESGEKRSKIRVVVENFQFIGGAGEEKSSGSRPKAATSKSSAPVADDDDLPF